MPYEPSPRSVDRQRMLTDLRDLIAILDARLVQLREHGPPDGVVATENLRNQMLGTIAELELEFPPASGQIPQIPQIPKSQ